MIPPKRFLPDIPSLEAPQPRPLDLLVHYTVYLARLLGVVLAEIGIRKRGAKSGDILPRSLNFELEEGRGGVEAGQRDCKEVKQNRKLLTRSLTLYAMTMYIAVMPSSGAWNRAASAKASRTMSAPAARGGAEGEGDEGAGDAEGGEVEVLQENDGAGDGADEQAPEAQAAAALEEVEDLDKELERVVPYDGDKGDAE
ncbi:hypothetical protein BJX64DRAFT_285391 [Aspergillus heterothallicus]